MHFYHILCRTESMHYSFHDHFNIDIRLVKTIRNAKTVSKGVLFLKIDYSQIK